MSPSQKEEFFIENISILNKEIELMCNHNNSKDKEKLKTLRQNLQILYLIRKQNGFQKKGSTKFEELETKRLEEYRIWVENSNK